MKTLGILGLLMASVLCSSAQRFSDLPNRNPVKTNDLFSIEDPNTPTQTVGLRYHITGLQLLSFITNNIPVFVTPSLGNATASSLYVSNTLTAAELDVAEIITTNGLAYTDTLAANLGTPSAGTFPIKYSSDSRTPGFVFWDASSRTWLSWLKSSNAIIVYTNSSSISAGLTLTNATPAAVGAQKSSPAVYFSGNGWSTSSNASMPVIFRESVTPAQGSATPTGSWNIAGSYNNGAFLNALSLTGNGNLTIIGSFVAGASGSIYFQGKSALLSSVDGAFETRNFGGTARATVQANVPQITKTTNYPIVALDSGLRFDNIGAKRANRLDLPTAVAGMHFYFYVDAAHNMQIQATGTDVIHDGSAASAAAGDIHSGTPYSTLHMFAPKAGHWVVDSKNGTWVGPQ